MTVTQVDQPNLVYIQRYPASGEDDAMLVDDSADVTAQNSYDELAELEELSFNINSEEFFGHDLENVPTNLVKEGKSIPLKTLYGTYLYIVLIISV